MSLFHDFATEYKCFQSVWHHSWKEKMCLGLLVVIAFYIECYKADKTHFQSGRRVKHVRRGRHRGEKDTTKRQTILWFFSCSFSVISLFHALCGFSWNAVLHFPEKHLYLYNKFPFLFKLIAKQFPKNMDPLELAYPHLSHAQDYNHFQALCLDFWLLLKSLSLEILGRWSGWESLNWLSLTYTPNWSILAHRTFHPEEWRLKWMSSIQWGTER